MKGTLAEKIAYLRRQQDMTLEELGNRVGVGKSTVRKWETGMITSIRSDKLSNLANALEVSIMDLIGEDAVLVQLPPPPGGMHIGVNILRRRKELLMTQEALALKMGVQKAAISKIELGSVDVSVSKVPAFARALETSVGELLDWMLEGE